MKRVGTEQAKEDPTKSVTRWSRKVKQMIKKNTADAVQATLKKYGTPGPDELQQTIDAWEQSRDRKVDGWQIAADTFDGFISPLLKENKETELSANDQSFWMHPNPRLHNASSFKDYMGPSLLFEDTAFKNKLGKLYKQQSRKFPILLACVRNLTCFNSDSVSMGYLLSMMVSLLRSYQRDAGLAVYSIFLYGAYTDKGNLKFMPGCETNWSARIKSLLDHRRAHPSLASTFRLTFLCAVNDVDTCGHWVLVGFDFQNDALLTADGFCFPEWGNGYEVFEPLIDMIAKTGRFEIAKKKFLVAATQDHLDKLLSAHTGLKSLEISCGYSMLRNFMICSVASNAELFSEEFIAALNELDKNHISSFVNFFYRLWTDLKTEKDRIEKVSYDNIVESNDDPDAKSVALQFLLVSGAFMGPCLDFTNDSAVPFDIVTVECPLDSFEEPGFDFNPIPISLQPRYYFANFAWSDTKDEPKEGNPCIVCSQADMLGDIMHNLNTRLSFIEKTFNK
jgi:hypothetical protein